ncbi:hypothetical protein RCL1_004021 [Eukaryota sp. TZLM3-RCL]
MRPSYDSLFSNLTDLVCRESQTASLKLVISRFLETKKGQVVFLTGIPGTGKTALVHSLCDTVFGKSCSWFFYTATISSIFLSLQPKNRSIIVIDEADRMEPKLKQPFSDFLSSCLDLSVLVIVISNDLLFSSHFSFLCSESIPFPAYNSLEIESILRHRLSLVPNYESHFTNVSQCVTIIAKRCDGDVRQAIKMVHQQLSTLQDGKKLGPADFSVGSCTFAELDACPPAQKILIFTAFLSCQSITDLTLTQLKSIFSNVLRIFNQSNVTFNDLIERLKSKNLIKIFQPSRKRTSNKSKLIDSSDKVIVLVTRDDILALDDCDVGIYETIERHLQKNTNKIIN